MSVSLCNDSSNPAQSSMITRTFNANLTRDVGKEPSRPAIHKPVHSGKAPRLYAFEIIIGKSMLTLCGLIHARSEQLLCYWYQGSSPTSSNATALIFRVSVLFFEAKSHLRFYLAFTQQRLNWSPW